MLNRCARIGLGRRRYLANLAVLTAASAVAAASLTQPDVKADEPVPEKVRKLLEGYKAGAQRVNGVLLKAEVEIQQPVSGDNRVLLHWTLDYNGPRPPLIILEPSLERPLSLQTSVIFYLIGADDEAYIVPFHAPTFDGPIAPAKEAFLTIKPGEVGRGTLKVKESGLREEARKRWPKQFLKGSPKLLYVKLSHSPTDRGWAYDLDAWTGEVATGALPVPVKQLRLE